MSIVCQTPLNPSFHHHLLQLLNVGKYEKLQIFSYNFGESHILHTQFTLKRAVDNLTFPHGDLRKETKSTPGGDSPSDRGDTISSIGKFFPYQKGA